jgi:hypothetical protein
MTETTYMIANTKDLSSSTVTASRGSGYSSFSRKRAMLMFVLMMSFLVLPVFLFQPLAVPGTQEQLYEGIHWPHQHGNEKTIENADLLNYHDFLNCSVGVVEDYFSNHFHESPSKLFDMTCLNHLIEQNPANLFTRTVFIRQYYLEYMATNPKRHVVYLCHSECGGLGDRIRAMVGSFFLAISLNATFTILTEYPVHLDEFFEPSIPELSLAAPNNFLSQVGLLEQYRQSSARSPGANDSALFDLNATLQGCAKTWTTAAVHSCKEFNLIFENWLEHTINWGYKLEHVEWFRHLNMENVMTSAASTADSPVALISIEWFRLQPYLFENPVMKDFVVRAHLTGMGRPEFSFIFFQLFMSTATPFLHEAAQRYFDNLVQEIPTRVKPYVVGAHIRLGDWSMKMENLSRADKRYPIEAVDCIATRIRQTCENRTACVVWVAGDNVDAIRRLQRLLANSTIKILSCDEGEINHLDLGKFDQSTDLRQANLRTFVDWYILAKYADEIVMTQSGFSEWASYYSMRNADVARPAWILAKKGMRRKMKCTWHNFTSYLRQGQQQSPYPYLYLP